MTTSYCAAVIPHYINALLMKVKISLSHYEQDTKKPEYRRTYIDKLYAHIHKPGYRKMPEKMYRE